MKIKIFIVRLYYNFYSSIGFCFGRFDWKHRWPIIKSIIMITLFINCSYYMYERYCREYKGISATKISQNAFGLLIDRVNSLQFMFSFILSFLVFSINGYDLIRLADSSIFAQIYTDNQRNHIISLAILIFTILDVLFLYKCFGEWSIRFQTLSSSLLEIINLYTMIIMLFNAILVRLMFVYFKNAIRLSLQRTRLQLEQNAITDAECICTIRLLGQISMKFHSKAGYLALIFFLDWTFYLIHTLLTIHQGISTIFYMIIVVLNLSITFLWLFMDHQIQQSFKNIIKQLRWRNDQQQQNFKIQTSKSMEHLLQLLDHKRQNSMDIDQLWPLFDQIGTIWLIKIRPQLRYQIRYFEMSELYQEYFRMNLYDLLIYDQRFLLSMIIFAYGYFVLIIQTEK